MALELKAAVDPFRLVKWKYSPSLLLAGANTLCSVVFQLGVLSKLGVGARSDLYFASIVTPMVLYTLAFGALSSVLIPMFVEIRASGGDENTLLWNGLFAVLAGGALLLVVSYYPMLYLFPLMFRRLAWLDLGQVGGVVLTYSAYQALFSSMSVKTCFLLAEGRPVAAQMGVLCGWFVSLVLLASVHPAQALWRIPFCLICGNAVALAIPNFPERAFLYQKGLLRQHAGSLASRALPITLGTSAGWVEPVIDGVIASTLKQGSLTIYYFFVRAMLYTVTAIFSGYIQPVTKHLAELASASRWLELHRQARRVVLKSALLGLGIVSIGLLTLSLAFTKLSFLRSHVSSFVEALPVFFLLLGYLFGAIAYAVYSNSLYILRRERLYLVASLATFPIGIMMKLSGAWLFGLKGLAVGTSIYWIMYAMSLSFCFSWAVRQRRTAARPSILSVPNPATRVELLE